MLTARVDIERTNGDHQGARLAATIFIGDTDTGSLVERRHAVAVRDPAYDPATGPRPLVDRITAAVQADIDEFKMELALEQPATLIALAEEVQCRLVL